MADLAVGLSRTVVAGALTKAQSVIEEDNKLRQKAQRDLVTITLEFKMMQSFLNVANGERAVNNLVRTWVKHVRELAYDLEDCVEFVVHLDDKPIFWRRLLPVCVVGPLPLDQAVADIEELKGRAKELSECYSRYSHINEPTSKLVMQQQQASSRGADSIAVDDMLVKAREGVKTQQCSGDLVQLITNKENDLQLEVISVWGTGGNFGATAIIRKAYNDPQICRNSVCAFFKKGAQRYGDKEKHNVCEVSPNSFLEKIPSSNKKAVSDWMENHPLIGRGLQMNELRNDTARAGLNNSPVISVWGIAGIGKSALVRNLYNERMLRDNQFNMYNWVDVSHPFNLRDFSRCLLSVYKSESYYLERDPIKECRELLSQYHCFVVIDGLQSKEEWDLIDAALVSRPSTSVIIVITTEASVATYCTTNKEQVFNIKGLEAAAAMDLFRKEVHRKNPSSPLNQHKDAELEELILKCGGIPRVIVSIAALLARESETLMDNVRSLNHKFMQHLETNPEYDSLRGLFDWMHSYFSTFPDVLKPCIFYLSVFPPGRSIQRRRLIRRWIAEGYSRDSDEESAVNKGESFFSKLLDQHN